MSRRTEMSNRVYASAIHSNANHGPNLSIMHIAQIGKTAARINFLHPNTKRKAFSRNDYSDAFAVLSNNEAYLIPQTVEVLPYDRANYRLVSGIIRANNNSIPYEEAIASRKLKVITANVFMDDENNTWNVEGEGDDRRLIQTRCEDFGQLISARMQRLGNLALASSKTAFEGSPVNKLEFVLAYDVDTHILRNGLVIEANANEFVAVDTKGMWKAKRQQVIAATETSLAFEAQLIAAVAEKDIKTRAKMVLDFLKDVYPDKNFMSDYGKLITAAVADCDAPLSAV